MKRSALFIGNSHTYLHYMPQMLVRLVTAGDCGFDLAVDLSIGEGVSLAWHWANESTRRKMRSRKWDYIVLQDRSGGPLEDLDSYQKHARLLDAEIKRRESKTIFYLTWAPRHQPERQQLLTKAYQAMANELEARLAPVGLAWASAQQLFPEIVLHHKDGRHASPVGAYLTACVFYSVICHQSPAGLPATFRIEGKSRPNQNRVQALGLQKLAWETVSNLESGRRKSENLIEGKSNADKRSIALGVNKYSNEDRGVNSSEIILRKHESKKR